MQAHDSVHKKSEAELHALVLLCSLDRALLLLLSPRSHHL
jgi:hypothetical protein